MLKYLREEFQIKGASFKTGKLKLLLYLSAILLIVIPIAIVLMSDVPFSSTFSHTIISTAIILLILGKMITLFEKKKENKSFAPDTGIIIGLSVVLILNFI